VELSKSYSDTRKKVFHYKKTTKSPEPPSEKPIAAKTVKQPDVKKIPTPVFSGSQEDVMEFNDFLHMFQDLIGNNTQYTETAKLMYLKNYLRGNALDTIKDLSNAELATELATIESTFIPPTYIF